jgi:signal transduction histidine kinase
VGQGYRGDPDDDLSAADTNEAGTLELGRENKVVADIVGRDVGSLIFLFLLIALVAGVAGWLAARALSAPFRRLAIAASALGRGRFDLDLPPTKIPEAQAIAQSLRTSALQLEARLSRERAFAEHASHVLRTPLTSLRLELEDLAIRRDVTSDVREAAQRCMACVDAVNTAAGELVALTRRGSLVEGSELTLHDLATELAQRWADRLAEQRRSLSAAVEGDLEMVFTPGPVEHVLDLVLADVVQAGGRGPVRITFHGGDDHLKVRMPAGVLAGGDGGRGRRAPDPGAGLAEARSLAESQGGRVRGDGVAEDLEILLPRR